MRSFVSLWPALVVAGLLQLSGCCCFEPKQECDPSLAPVVRAKCIFLKESAGNFAQFHLQGSFSTLGICTPDQIDLTAIEVFGMSGSKSAVDVGQAAHLLANVPLPAPKAFTWTAESKDMPKDKLIWDAGPDYTLLVRYTYIVNGVASVPHTADWLRKLTGLTPSPDRTFQVLQLHPGDTISNFRAHATFSGAVGQGFYDAQVTFTPPTNSHPMQIDLYAAPIDAANQLPPGFPRPHDLLLSDTSAAIATSPWSANDLTGTYVAGSNTYGLLVRITYADNSTNQPITPAPETSLGTFTNILANLGHVEVIE